MKWIPISERLPEKDGWYITWKPGYAKDNWDIDHFVDGRFIDGHGVTHWAEVTGPEDCCEWIYDEFHSYYERTCLPEDPFGISNYEGLSQNNIHHCPHCGRVIKEVK